MAQPLRKRKANNGKNRQRKKFMGCVALKARKLLKSLRCALLTSRLPQCPVACDEAERAQKKALTQRCDSFKFYLLFSIGIIIFLRMVFKTPSPVRPGLQRSA
jgi:hypothetical protein